MAANRKRLRWLVEYAALYPLFLVARLLPLRLAVAVGRGAGRLAYRVFGIRRKVVRDNLRAALGGALAKPDLDALAGRSYANLGGTLLEFCKLHDTPRSRLLSWVDCEGRERLDELRAAGRGALLTTGHFGNWELLGAVVAASGYPISFLIKDQSNPHINRLQNEIRRRAGIGVIRQGASVRHLLYALRRGEFVGILGDQDAGSQGVFIEFLGRPASAFRGIAYIAWRTGCPIVPSFLVRQRDGRHRAFFTAPIEVDPAWDEQTAVPLLTRAHNERLEAFVRAHPDHYFWVHRRWKTQPPPRAGAE